MREYRHTVHVEKHRVPESIAVLTFESAGEVEAPRPLVFVVHGLLSRKERHIDLCLALAGEGFLACTVDARHHGERATPEVLALLGGQVSAGFAAAFADAVLGTVADLGILADYLGRDR